jgi:gamma-glutamylaminecyclotransferase
VKLFVYGSLLSGEDNHALLYGSRRIGDSRTAPRYSLVDLGAYPALIEPGRTSIRGEVYEVDAATLAALDEFEGHPHLYERILVELTTGDVAIGYALRETWLAEGRAEIADGDWRRHSSLADRRPPDCG